MMIQAAAGLSDYYRIYVWSGIIIAVMRDSDLMELQSEFNLQIMHKSMNQQFMYY